MPARRSVLDPEIPSLLLSILDVWLAGQTQLARVERWQWFPLYDGGTPSGPSIDRAENANGHPQLILRRRPQNDLQHSLALSVLCGMVLAEIDGGLDRGLLLTACPIHDQGEAELGRDIGLPDKGIKHDLAEWRAFERRFAQAPGWWRMQDAFLLQFALLYARPEWNGPYFPEFAQVTLDRLARTHRIEARIFEFLERLDYMFYALDAYVAFRNPTILYAVLGNGCSPERMGELVGEVPSLQKFWTREVDSWARSFRERYTLPIATGDKHAPLLAEEAAVATVSTMASIDTPATVT